MILKIVKGLVIIHREGGHGCSSEATQLIAEERRTLRAYAIASLLQRLLESVLDLWYWLLHHRSQVRTIVGLVDVEAVLVMVGETLAYEVFALVTDRGSLGEDYLASIQYRLVSYDCHLRLIMAKWFLSKK
jgi:hypothetical protein